MTDLRPSRTAPEPDEPTVVDRHPALAQAEHHRTLARALAHDGAPARAFTELLKALRAAPAEAALCTEVLALARKAGLEVAAAAALEESWHQAQPAAQPTFHRALARLWRRQGRLDQARLHLYQLLAGAPEDVRAQLELAHLLAREARYQELCHVLSRAAQQAHARKRYARAHRAQLTRGRLLSTPVGDLPGAALAFALAGDAASRLGDREAAVSARLLAQHALARAGASADDRVRASERLREAGDAAGSRAEAERAAEVLERGSGPDAARLLIERAVLAEARGAQGEAVALWEAALEANPSATDAAERLARLLTLRKAWSELAEFRGRLAERAQDPAARVAALRQRAEVLERHLKDPGGAAQAWSEVFRATGDPAALHAQLERLERAGGPAAADAALDRVVAQAPDLQRKGAALRVRAERHLNGRRFGLAAADLQRLAQLQPLSPAEHLRLCECRAEEGDAQAIQELWTLAQPLAPGAPNRADVFRRLARLSAWPLNDAERSRAAWAEVLRELPGDPEAEERLLQLARARNRPDELVPILQSRAARHGRGPQARQARHDLARLLEKLGRDAEALEAWQAAVRAEPGDAEAQLALAERLESRGALPAAALAYEAAAQGLDDARTQGEAWARLAVLARKLGQPERSQAAAARARTLGASLPEPEPLPPVPAPPALRDSASNALERRSSRSTARKRTKTDPARIPLTRAAPEHLLASLDHAPLDPRVHAKMADHFERKGDVLRASLFTEVAHALEGDPDAEPLVPKGTLSATALLALRHPELRGPWVEALHLCGELLAGQAAVSRRGLVPFAPDAGRGAPVAAQALLDAVRILGQRAPDVVVSPEEGPPFALEPSSPVQLAVGKGAVKKPWSAAELRFFAGRALYSLAPELLALRLLDADQLAQAMGALLEGLASKGRVLAKPKGLAARLSARGRERLVELLEPLGAARPDWDRLMLAARHSANRAGLVCAGGVAPTLRALQAKRANPEELSELIRFATSDRMVRMRLGRL